MYGGGGGGGGGGKGKINEILHVQFGLMLLICLDSVKWSIVRAR